jgi:hypothetical protein
VSLAKRAIVPRFQACEACCNATGPEVLRRFDRTAFT